MNILIVADWHGAEIYAEVFKTGFEKLGHTVARFSWKEYFHHYQYPDRYETDGNKLKSIYYRFQNKLIIGPVISKINRDLIVFSEQFSPDFIFVYRGSHILPATLKILKQHSNCKIYGYNNDDPFSPKYPKYLWRHFLAGVPEYDHLFCYRQQNIADFNAIGAKQVSILRSYYTAERNYPVDIACSAYQCDVIFIGHFEDDGRDLCLLSLLQSQHKVRVFGTGWSQSLLYQQLVTLNGPIEPLYDDYNHALNSAKIALVFLSKLNRDTYTRRCFEIPATGTLMLSEYTEDLNSLFKKGIEADYFTSADELLAKVNFYLSNPKLLNEVAENGRRRLICDGHEVIDRIHEVLAVHQSLMLQK